MCEQFAFCVCANAKHQRRGLGTARRRGRAGTRSAPRGSVCRRARGRPGRGQVLRAQKKHPRQRGKNALARSLSTASLMSPNASPNAWMMSSSGACVALLMNASSVLLGRVADAMAAAWALGAAAFSPLFAPTETPNQLGCCFLRGPPRCGRGTERSKGGCAGTKNVVVFVVWKKGKGWRGVGVEANVP